MNLMSLPLAYFDKTAIGKSQLEVWGAAIMMYLSICEGKSLGTFQPKTLYNINSEILFIQ
jgi:hypothetical protein